MTEREYCIKTYGEECGNAIADHWIKERDRIKANPTIIQVQPRRITEAEKLLLESISLLEQSRDRLLYRAEARLQDKVIDEFIARCREAMNATPSEGKHK